MLEYFGEAVTHGTFVEKAVLKSYFVKQLAFKCPPQKMVKHSQPIRWQQVTNYLSVLDHFLGLALRALNRWL